VVAAVVAVEAETAAAAVKAS